MVLEPTDAGDTASTGERLVPGERQDGFHTLQSEHAFDPGNVIEPFNPFGKRIADLTAPDLAVLKTVIEGWHVEYKRTDVGTSRLAKAISSFANTYGGWLFLGIEEAGKGDPVAGSFPGIPVVEVDTARQHIRQAAAQHLNPTPHFETKVIEGPCAHIDLPEGNVVIVAHVPQSVTAPHIHKDGRIYRRVGDSSEPKPETDRFAIDQLSERANRVRQTISGWVHGDPAFTATEKRTPYLRFMFCPDPWLQRNPSLDASMAEIRELFASPDDSTSIVYDVVHPEPGGVVARQVMDNDPLRIGLTCHLRWDLRCDLIVPIAVRSGTTFDELRNVFRGYENASAFVDVLESQGFHNPHVADLNFVWMVLLGGVHKYRRLMRLAGVDEPSFYFKARALNFQCETPSPFHYGSPMDASDFHRTVPFVDIGEIIEDFRLYGVPVPMDTIATLPTGDAPDSFRNIPPYADQAELLQTALQASLVFAFTSSLFGFSLFDDGPTTSSDASNQADARTTAVAKQLTEIGTRALAVQSRLQR